MNQKQKSNLILHASYPRIIVSGHNKNDTKFLAGNAKILAKILQS